jgi:hypothetical protein
VQREVFPYQLGDGYLNALVDVELKVLTYDFAGDSAESSILDGLQQ